MQAGISTQQPLMRSQLSTLSLLRMSLDPLLIVLSFVFISLLYGDSFDGAELVLILLVFSLSFPGRIQLSGSSIQLLRDVLTNWIAVAGILFFFGWASTFINAYDSRVLITWASVVPILLFGVHRAIPVVLPRLLAMEGLRSAVIVGLTDCGRKLGDQFVAQPMLGVQLTGFFDDRATERLGEAPPAALRGPIDGLADYVKAQHTDAIFIALPMASQPRILNLLDDLRDTTTSIYFVPDIFLYDLIQARMDLINGIPVVAICESPFYGVNGLIKRLEDVVLGLLILILIAPLMALIAIGVRCTSPGPAIFKQRRYGLDGEEITVYKFRSMRVMEDGAVVTQATRRDTRITALGAFLRRTSLDELPQFINVLQGRMSIVGPRPHAIAHNEMYRGMIKGYMIRHKVRPGITGLAQVSGCRGETDTLDKMRARIDWDLHYLRNWSLRLDLMIILRTVLTVIKGDRQAY